MKEKQEAWEAAVLLLILWFGGTAPSIIVTVASNLKDSTAVGSADIGGVKGKRAGEEKKNDFFWDVHT